MNSYWRFNFIEINNKQIFIEKPTKHVIFPQKIKLIISIPVPFVLYQINPYIPAFSITWII